MKILYNGLQYNYYDSRKGLTFEHQNFYSSLKALPGVNFVEYLSDAIPQVGKAKFNQGLLELVENEKPDLFFVFMHTDELDPKVLESIKKLTTSVAWFADDHWRLYNYSRFWARHFTWAVTTWSKGPAEYGRYGIKNIIRSQWACNTNVWKPVETKRDIDVNFVGLKNQSRARLVKMLRDSGVNVFVRGLGWPEGRVSQDELVKIISRSKINLNFNTPMPLLAPRAIGRVFFRRSRNRFAMPDLHFASNLKGWWRMRIPQIKARPFELAGCRAFVITGYADDFENYYKENEEMAFYRSPRELVEKVKYYLPRAEERERIAKAAYDRTMAEHTYQKRFAELFTKIGIS